MMIVLDLGTQQILMFPPPHFFSKTCMYKLTSVSKGRKFKKSFGFVAFMSTQ